MQYGNLLNTFPKHIGNRNLFKLLLEIWLFKNISVKERHSDWFTWALLAGGGALLSKNSHGIQSHGMWGFHEHWILTEAVINVYKSVYSQRKPKEAWSLISVLLESWRNLTQFNPVNLLYAKLYARLPKRGYLAASHGWSSDHVILWCRQ